MLINPGVLVAMSAFALAMSTSPGPVNMVIVASGAQHGFGRTLPFVAGATLGFTLLLVLVGVCLQGSIDEESSWLKVLSIAGSAFIAYVGYRLAVASPEIALETRQRPAPAFKQGFLLQWLNPKAWIACASGVSLFADPKAWSALGLFATLYALICFASLAGWALMGDRMSSLLTNPGRVRAFNLIMGGLLIATAAHMAVAQLTR
jgi:threonine/homoserine/homoserine lactone efflux protein